MIKIFREILQNVDSQLLLKGLKAASEELKEKVFRNLSQAGGGDDARRYGSNGTGSPE